MKGIKEIKELIADEDISDDEVKKDISRLDSLNLNKDEKLEIISFLKEKRLNLFTIWQL